MTQVLSDTPDRIVVLYDSYVSAPWDVLRLNGSQGLANYYRIPPTHAHAAHGTHCITTFSDRAFHASRRYRCTLMPTSYAYRSDLVTCHFDTATSVLEALRYIAGETPGVMLSVDGEFLCVSFARPIRANSVVA
jgi:hypothetical protein